MDAMGQMGFRDCRKDFRSSADDREALSRGIDDGAVYGRQCKRDILCELLRKADLAWSCCSYTLRTCPGAGCAGELSITSGEWKYRISDVRFTIGDELST